MDALALARASGDLDVEAMVQDQLGVLKYRKGELAAAEKLHLAALELLKRTGYRRLMPSVLVNLGNVAKDRGNDQEAGRRYLEAKEAAEFPGGADQKSAALNNLAILELNSGRSSTAEQAFEEVRVIRQELGDAIGLARVTLNLGIVAQMKGNLALAKARYDEALKRALAISFGELEGKAHFRLGDLLRFQGRFREAIPELMVARRVLVDEQRGSPGNRVEVLSALAECKSRSGQATEAEALLREARQLNQDLPQILRAQAWIHRFRGEGRLAEECLARALEDPRKEDPEHRNEIQDLLASWRAGR